MKPNARAKFGALASNPAKRALLLIENVHQALEVPGADSQSEQFLLCFNCASKIGDPLFCVEFSPFSTLFRSVYKNQFSTARLQCPVSLCSKSLAEATRRARFRVRHLTVESNSCVANAPGAVQLFRCSIASGTSQVQGKLLFGQTNDINDAAYEARSVAAKFGMFMFSP